MKIRWKLLILLMLIALVPLIAATIIHNQHSRRLGDRLATDTREILTRDASRQMEFLVDHYGRLITRVGEALEMALQVQVHEVQQRLAAEAPADPTLYFSADYDKGEKLPPGMRSSTLHIRYGDDGQAKPVSVTYEEQVAFLAAGVRADDAAVADDLARLSTMAKAYGRVNATLPGVMYWQYTSTETGIHTCYPGHGGYPAEFDPRVRPWYVRAKTTGKLDWSESVPDVSTRSVTLTLSAPVRRPDGTLAGVTAIDILLTGIFSELRLPEELAEHAEIMIILPGPPGTPVEGKLLILAQKSYQTLHDWRTLVKMEVLTSSDTEGLTEMGATAGQGRCSVRAMPHKGQASIWACGASDAKGRPFPVVIVPEEAIVAQAVEAERYVWSKIIQGLQLSGAVMLAAVVVVTIVSLSASRLVTKPIRELAAAGKRLAGGDYGARVDIRTGDELQELATVFNDTGPKLLERESLKRSLALAMEVQQHLLPGEAPAIEGFDVAGQCDYCDETGGDYYDFLQAVEVAPGLLGIAVGDVTGHGIGAALLMASARAVLRSHLGRYEGDLSALLAALNEHLYRDTGDGRFMTLFVGLLDGPGRLLRWASGGHDPALWLRKANGSFEELPNTGVPLGILEGAPFDQSGPVALESGDIVVIGTDGIWEAANQDQDMFGKLRLQDVIAANAERSAEEIHQAVVAAVHAFRGAEPQKDDITLVVIKGL